MGSDTTETFDPGKLESLEKELRFPEEDTESDLDRVDSRTWTLDARSPMESSSYEDIPEPNSVMTGEVRCVLNWCLSLALKFAYLDCTEAGVLPLGSELVLVLGFESRLCWPAL